jgi:hypothetical protein
VLPAPRRGRPPTRVPAAKKTISHEPCAHIPPRGPCSGEHCVCVFVCVCVCVEREREREYTFVHMYTYTIYIIYTRTEREILIDFVEKCKRERER